MGDGRAVELSYNGAPVTVGQFGAWTFIAAQQTATGYEVALENMGADHYGVWDTDASGNFVSGPISNVSGTSAALESIEISFNDDLNGDGTIGVPVPSNATLIESSGTTSLLTDGTYYYLRTGDGPAVYAELWRAPVTAGEFGAWTPIAAQQTATGFEVALKTGGRRSVSGVGHGQQRQLRLSSAQQRIGHKPRVGVDRDQFQLRFERRRDHRRSFRRDERRNDRRFSDADRVIRHDQPADRRDQLFSSAEWGAAVTLSYGGSPVVVGEFGAWTPIAAQQTATGYEVALEEWERRPVWGVGHRRSGNLVSGSDQQRIGSQRRVGVDRDQFQL